MPAEMTEEPLQTPDVPQEVLMFNELGYSDFTHRFSPLVLGTLSQNNNTIFVYKVK